MYTSCLYPHYMHVDIYQHNSLHYPVKHLNFKFLQLEYCIFAVQTTTTTTTTTKAPTTTTAAPAPSSSGGGGCFASSATVKLGHQKVLAMAELQIGDQVETGTDRYFISIY